MCQSASDGILRVALVKEPQQLHEPIQEQVVDGNWCCDNNVEAMQVELAAHTPCNSPRMKLGDLG